MTRRGRGRGAPGRRWRWALAAATAINAALLVALVAAVIAPLPAQRGDWSTVVEYRDGTPAYVFLSRDDKWRLPVALDDVDPAFVAALVALEDKRFWRHDGVDGIAIARAAITNAAAGTACRAGRR